MIPLAGRWFQWGQTGFFSLGVCLVFAVWSLSLQAAPTPQEAFVSLALKADSPEAFVKAEALFQKIQTSGGASLSDNPRIVWGLVRLAEFYLGQGNLAKAKAYQIQALRLLERKQGFSNLLLLVAPLNGLANIWFAQGQIPQARQSLERALDIVERTLGATHLLAVRILEQLAQIHVLQGNPQRALQMQKRVAEIQEFALMPSTPGHAVVLSRLAKHYHQADQDTLAKPLFLQAKEILMNTSGPYHGARVEILVTLAELAKKDASQNPWELRQAMEALKSALAISENMKGRDHPDLVPILKNLAEVYQKMGRLDQSRLLIVRVISLVEKLYGPDHEKTAEAVFSLAENLRMENQPDPALSIYNQALVIFRHQDALAETVANHLSTGSTNAPSHPENHSENIGLARTLIGLAKTLRMQGKIIVAESNHREALEILVKTLGPEHPDCIAARHYQTALEAEIEGKTQTSRLSPIDFLKQVQTMQERLLIWGDDP